MKKIMTFSVTCKHKTDLYIKKNGIKITTYKSYVTMFWHYLLLKNIKKKLGRKVSLEIMVQFYKNYSTTLIQL